MNSQQTISLSWHARTHLLLKIVRVEKSAAGLEICFQRQCLAVRPHNMYNQVTYETYLKTFINTQNHAQQCQDSLPSLDHSSTVSCLVFTMFYRVLSLRNFTSEWSVLVHMCPLAVKFFVLGFCTQHIQICTVCYKSTKLCSFNLSIYCEI